LQQKKTHTQMEKHDHHEIRQDIVDEVCQQQSETCCQKTNRR
jgi:hypothetical protein